MARYVPTTNDFIEFGIGVGIVALAIVLFKVLV